MARGRRISTAVKLALEDTAAPGMRMKRRYEPPVILHTEKIEARAVACAKADELQCQNGPIES